MNDTVPSSQPPIPASGGWLSGGMGSALRVVAAGDLIEITDGSQQEQPLLVLSREQAANLADELASVLDIVGWRE